MGEVITFYSYKGGTGRSMALSNVACLLAERVNNGVLMIDWDLEAPGLNRFFRNRCKRYFKESSNLDKDLDAHLGLIDLFNDLDNFIGQTDDLDLKDEDELADILSKSLDIEKYIIKTDIPSLSLLTSGRLDTDYQNKVRKFPWEDLYNRAPQLLLALTSLLERRYEYILIDSRTGLTDTSGICTKVLPSKLVIVFTPNRQSLEGAVDIAYQAIEYRRKSNDLRPLVVFPLVSRIDGEEADLRKFWRFGQMSKDIKGYEPEFKNIFKRAYGLKKLNLNKYFDDVQIQYIPRYSYGEEVAVLVEKSKDRLSLTRSYKKFVDWLVGTSGPWSDNPRPVPLMLPPSIADFTGREKELDLLASYFHRGSTIVCVRGMGGVGKTTLALKLANNLKSRYPDGQIMVDLKGTSKNPVISSDAMEQVIRSYYPTNSSPKSESELKGRYLSLLEGKRVLLVFDNAFDDQQLRPLLPPSSCGVIITSRRKFSLPGLTALDLDVLKPYESQELMLKIWNSTIDYALQSSDDPAWSEIARLCGYLPLALRAAASLLANTPDLSPPLYAQVLKDEHSRLKQISDEGVELSVDASLNLSYNQLDTVIQKTFLNLSVFPVDFDGNAEEIICQDKGLRNLRELVRWSLVDYRPTEPDYGRYNLHDLVRLFALSRQSDNASQEIHQRHSEYFKTKLSVADDLYQKGGPSIQAGLALFDREKTNIIAGQAWAEKNLETSSLAAELCMSYPVAGTHVIDLRLHPMQKISWLENALKAASRLKDHQIEGLHLGSLGRAYLDLGQSRLAINYFEQALEIAQEIGNRWSEGDSLGGLGNAYSNLGEPREAIEFYEQALKISKEIGDRRGEGNRLSNLGNAYSNLGEPRKAIEFYEQALKISKEIGDRRGEGVHLGNLGLAYFDLGEPRKAIEFYEQALKISKEIGDRRGEGVHLGNLGLAYFNLGQPRKAIEFYDDALKILKEIGDRRGEGADLSNMSLSYNDLGQQEKAISLAKSALEIFEQIESPHAEAVRQNLAEWGA